MHRIASRSHLLVDYFLASDKCVDALAWRRGAWSDEKLI
jgi:hypothetical protein